MIDLNSLPVFARVAESLSFSEAARQLRMPVSTVSRKIADLEGCLGVQLIERTTRQLRLTEIGIEVLDEARRSAELGEAVNSIVSNRLIEVRGRITLSTPPSIADSLLAPILASFQEIYPEVLIRVFVTDRMVDHLAEGIDLALRVGELGDSTLITKPLLTYRHQLLASPEYIEEHGSPLHPGELADHRMVTFGSLATKRRWTLDSGSESKVTILEPKIVMNDYAGIARMLVNGVGLGDLPPIVCPHLVAEGRLIEVMPDWRFRPQNLSLVRPGQRYVSKPLRLFMDFASSEARRLFQSLPA